jgi:hypothetical protein
MIRKLGWMSGAALLTIGSGCVATVRPARVAVVAPAPSVSVTYVDREPPPPNYEIIPRAPVGDYVWVGGCWTWNTRAYVWVPGRYMLRPHPRAVWVPGRWMHHPRGYYWTEGSWR